MGTTYTATIDVRCWKQHTCVCCGGNYAYDFKRKVRAQGNTEDAAQVNVRAAAVKTMEREVDLRPCPTCGLYQPDMVGRQRSRRHWMMFWGALALLALLLILRGANVMQSYVATWAIAITAALALLGHLLIDISNPNASLDSNINLAAGYVAEGSMFHQPGQRVPGSEVEWASPGKSIGQKLALLMLVVAVVAVIFPEGMRMTRGWPVNDECYPPVVGPGDSTRVYMPEKISSIKGYWRGKAEARLQVQGEKGKRILAATSTNQKDWGTTIYAKSREKSSSSRPWVQIGIPEQAENLVGKTVDCDIRLAVVYPVASGKSFNENTKLMQEKLTIQMAPAGAGERYNDAWWTWTLIAALMIPGCGVLLAGAARSFATRANPSQVIPMQEQSGPTA